MKNVPKTSALAQLKANYFCWKQFEAECQRRGMITMAFMMATRGQAKEKLEADYTAFQIIEPEAQAWLNYFRQTGTFTQSSDVSHKDENS